MIKYISKLAKLLFGNLLKNNDFCNIAEGTHSGCITMRAGENIENTNLIVCAGDNEGDIKVSGYNSVPIGVCNDQGDQGDMLNVVLPGSCNSSIMVVTATNVSAGDILYSASYGRVSTSLVNGTFKVGVALCSATTGNVVEVDPQGFGTKCLGIDSAGKHHWTNSTTTDTMTLTHVSSTDLVFAWITNFVGNATTVSAVANDGSISFTLDENGSPMQTEISWFIIKI